MEFGIKKCGVLVLKHDKIVKMEGIVLPDWQVMREIDDSGYKYLGETRDLFSKEYKHTIQYNTAHRWLSWLSTGLSRGRS